MTGPVSLVLGGARSGKSRYAEALVDASGLAKIYLATCEAWDDEMRERILQHQARRGPEWTTLAAPLDLAVMVSEQSSNASIVLVDCLTLWINNLMMAERDTDVAFAELAAAAASASGPVVFVSNEVGMGIVPENAMARRFRDAQGQLNQMIAAMASDVVFVAAGLPLTLKGDAKVAA